MVYVVLVLSTPLVILFLRRQSLKSKFTRSLNQGVIYFLQIERKDISRIVNINHRNFICVHFQEKEITASCPFNKKFFEDFTSIDDYAPGYIIFLKYFTTPLFLTNDIFNSITSSRLEKLTRYEDPATTLLTKVILALFILFFLYLAIENNR